MAELPCVARSYCPRCEPDADPIAEVLVVSWCGTHAPARSGLDDGAVSLGADPSLTVEAGGADNQRWCELIHGGNRLTPARRAARSRAARPAPRSR